VHFTSHQPIRFGFVLFVASLIAVCAALPAAASPRKTAGPYDWQSFGHDSAHDSYVNDPAISVSNAPGSGLRVMTNLLSATSGGPAIAFNPTTNSTLVFSGDRAGNISAIQDGTGQTVWTTSLGPGASVVGTPLVSSDQSAVWVATAVKPALYELNAATGAVMCSVTEPLAFQASPTEGTASNGSLLVYIPTVASATQSGALVAVNESTCATQFTVSSFRTTEAGSVASSAFGVDAGGRDLIIQGTSHPDSTVYAIDATTGAVDWSYVVDPSGATDVAAAATISPPGTNGFADGVAYIVAQNQICYALDLTTGAVIWQYNFGANALTKNGIGHSSAALDGNTLVFGMADGAYALNATTGARLWHYTDPAKVEAVSSPAIIGAPGSEVVALGDLSGAFHILSLQNGADLYDYQTGNYITASAADFNGDIVIASTDGFMYDFTPGGLNGSAPKTAWTAPAQGSNVPYASTVTITGTATDAAGVAAVQVAVQSGGPLGPWYDLTTNTWTSGALTNAVPVATPGATSTSWSFTVPVPSVHGAVLQVYANAVNINHRADLRGVKVSFGVTASASSPSLKPSAVFVPPGTSFSAVASGFRASEIVLFSANGKALGSAFANSSGTATGTLKVPVNMPFGPVPLKASGVSSGDIATAQIDFANSWLQNNDGPLHHGFEPNDYTFAALRPPVVNSLLSEAWYYAAGAPVESSPAVSNGTVYFGNDAGTLTAISVDNPVPLWTYTIPTGAAIRSAPAVDQTSGNTIVTADDGNVYIVNSATGAPVGKPITIGGLLTSPTLSNSRIFVGSDKGTVTCINESTGAIIWTHQVKGPVHSIPAVDWTMNMVVVGDDTGVITAFLTGSGLQLWQFTTLGAVTVSPSINNGSV
jgi:outer membrane protein assembly factor BamB